MNPVRMVRALPQPLKALTILVYAGFLVIFVVAAVFRASLLPVAGVLMTLWCACVALNINKSTDALAREFRKQSRGAFNLSHSFFGSALYFRLTGALGVGFGIFWTAMVLGFPN